ncbi:haloalkane dehalogenase [Aeromicrobium sp.]|uniref:haloalkane dehalogenase n=1 Tax=Aeromicrobium sp. TaxID=1871063 RepID=UPI003D6C2D34
MDVIRTPDERFENLPGYPFEPHWVSLDSGDGSTLRMHYVDEGPRDGAVIVLLHGEPTWSYLYRTMIPPLVEAGYRVLAPDLIGFGKSDKPAAIADYTYQRHVDWVTSWLDTLGVDGITLFGQDWGSLIGLRIAGEQPERFARIVISNGFLPTAHHGTPLAFRAWRAFARWTPVFPAGRLVQGATVTKVGPDVRAAYDAPFPSSKYQAGARAFPRLVPTDADNVAVPANRAAWEALGRFERPFLAIFGRNDPILGKGDGPLIAHVPGAQGQPHDRIRGGHFIQEDAGPELARRMIAW